jgi:hypothetical protein
VANRSISARRAASASWSGRCGWRNRVLRDDWLGWLRHAAPEQDALQELVRLAVLLAAALAAGLLVVVYSSSCLDTGT